MSAQSSCARVAGTLAQVASWGLLACAGVFVWATWKCVRVALADGRPSDLAPYGVLAVLLLFGAPLAAVFGIRYFRTRSMLAEATKVRTYAIATVCITIIGCGVIGVLAVIATIGVGAGG